MAAADVLMAVGVGVAALIVVAWLVAVYRGRNAPPARQHDVPRPDTALNPWAGGPDGRGRW